jgi:hypothetical protein
MDMVRASQILRTVLDRVQPAAAGVDHRLVGTGAALLQGVTLPVGDLDILVRHRADVDGFASAFSAEECLHRPQWLPPAQQYYAAFLVADARVEVSTVEFPVTTDTVECAGDGPWKHWVPVAVGPHTVPVVRLELRLVSELVRDRPERYQPLLAADLDGVLVRRAMRDRNVPPALQERILRTLR